MTRMRAVEGEAWALRQTLNWMESIGIKNVISGMYSKQVVDGVHKKITITMNIVYYV